MNRKKIFITIIIIIIGITIGGIFYYINKNKKSNVTVTDSSSEYEEFDPFGTSTNESEETSNKEESDVKETTQFYRVSDEPISSAIFYLEKKYLSVPKTTETVDEKTGETKTTEINYEMVPSIRFIERATGHINSYELSSKKTSEISSTTIPGIEESFFNENGDTVIYRYLSSDNKTIKTFLAQLGKAQGEFLTENIDYVITNSEKNKIFYLIRDNSSVNGYYRNFENSSSAENIFTNSYSEWIPQWINDNTIYFTTKASYSFKGSVFAYNLKTKTFKKIFGGIYGLTTLSSNDGNKILYNESNGSNSYLSIFDVKNNKTIETRIFGLPEKCVWDEDNISIYCAVPNSTSSKLPDSWYQGLTSFNDKFIKINSNIGSYEDLFNSITVTQVDAINLFMDNNQSKIFFTNKKDYTLWVLKL